jgi:hypothetical protein
MAHPDDEFQGSVYPKLIDFQSTKPPVWQGEERRGSARLPVRCQEDIAKGICEGATRILKDKELLKGFWQAGFDEFVEHGQKKGAQWIGSKILSWILTSLMMAALAVAAYMVGKK